MQVWLLIQFYLQVDFLFLLNMVIKILSHNSFHKTLIKMACLWLVFCMLLMQNVYSAFVYGPSPYFHSEYCGYNSFTQGSTSVTCMFTYPQSNIQRSTLSLAQISKPSGYNIVFETSFALSSTYPYISITITITSYNVATIRLGFFFLLIKTQSSAVKNIDFIFFSVSPGSAVDNGQSIVRSASKINYIATDSIMTNVDALTLKLIPFTTQFGFYLSSTVTNDPRSEFDLMFQYQVSAVSSNLIKHQLIVQPFNTMSGFAGFALLVNINLFVNANNAFIANPSLTPNDYVLHKFRIGDPAQSALTVMDFQTDFPNFGTSFDHKCIFGLQRLKFTQFVQFQFHVINNTYESFQKYTQSLSTPLINLPQSTNTFFCHGYNVQCSDSTPLFDRIDGNCYSALTCSLPVPDAMPVPYRCPWCEQFICIQCNPTNRLQCLTCMPGSNSVLNTMTKLCECMPGYLPVYIDLSPVVFSGGATLSLTSCTLNCSAAIKGCVETQCTSSTICSQCMVGYLVWPVASSQLCLTCSSFIVGCAQCSNNAYCTVCQQHFYRYDVMSNPAPPATPVLIGRKCASCLPNCKTCTGGATCTQCYPGYISQSSNTVCKCDPVISGLPNCQTCTTNNTCTTCYTKYFKSPITSLCISCVLNSIGCKTCNDQNTCVSCIDGYGLINVGIRTYCDVCFLNIDYCQRCADLDTCTRCMAPFGLNDPTTCVHCSILICAGCIQCFDLVSPCTKCDSLSFLINGSCFFCQVVHPQCISCQFNPTYNNLDCVQCKVGYFVHFNTVTNTQQCLRCIDAIVQCLQCTNQTFCTKCQYPNQISPNMLCESCHPNFVNYDNGLCMAQAGCMDAYQPISGNQTCLSCRDYLFYDYNPDTHLCDCQHGYIQTIGTISQRKCVAICGDGILIESNQQCDDGNIHDHDGCDSSCFVEVSYKCSMSSPSKCVLYKDFGKFEFVYVQRVLGQNKGVMHFLIQPMEIRLTTVDWTKIITINFHSSTTAVNQSLITYKYIYERGQLLVTVPYNEDLQTTNITYTAHFDYNLTTNIIHLNIKANRNKCTTNYLGSLFTLYMQNILVHIIGTVYFSVDTILCWFLYEQDDWVVDYTDCSVDIFYQDCSFAQKYQCDELYKFTKILFYWIQQSGGYIWDYNDEKESANIALVFINRHREIFLCKLLADSCPIGSDFILYSNVPQTVIKEQIPFRKNFIKMHRLTQWMYNHFVFPQMMMFCMIVHFSIILSLELNENLGTSEISKIYMQSIGAEMFMEFGIFAIITYEIFQNLNLVLHPFRQQPMSLMQKLCSDKQSQDRANYHPFYIITYLVFYLIQIIVISLDVEVNGFDLALEIVIGMNLLYLVLINCWQPYFKVVNVHNRVLKFNHVGVVVCLGIYEIVHRTQRMTSLLYIVLVSIMLSFILLLIITGFYRVLVEHQYRKKLSLTNKSKFATNNVDLLDQFQGKKLTKKQKKQALLQKNPYAFKNQLKQLKKSYDLQKGFDLNKRLQEQEQQQKQIIQKIRDQFKMKNNFYNDLFSNNYNQSLQDGLLNPLTVKNSDKSNYQQKNVRRSSEDKQQNNQKDQILEKKTKFHPKNVHYFHSQEQKDDLLKIKSRLKSEWNYMQGL